jgi:hypothetical protein
MSSLIVILILSIIICNPFEYVIFHDFEGNISLQKINNPSRYFLNRNQRANVDVIAVLPTEFTWESENILISGEGIVYCNITSLLAECEVELYFQAYSKEDQITPTISKSIFVFLGNENHQENFNLTLWHDGFPSNNSQITWTLWGSYNLGPGQYESIEEIKGTILILNHYWEPTDTNNLTAEEEGNKSYEDDNYSYLIIICIFGSLALVLTTFVLIIRLKKRPN